MSLAQQTARGAAWTIASSVGSRAVGIAGTLITTRYLAPEVIGEISVASILVMTTNWLTIWGFGQYVIVKGRGDDAAEVTFHTTVAHLTLGILGLGLVALLGGYLTPALGAAGAAAFVPGLALAALLARVGSVPIKILVRRMEFRPIAISSAIGEFTYGAVTVVLAMRGWGGYAVVVGNLAQSTITTLIIFKAAGFREWTTPVPLRWARFRDMIHFGLPLSVQGVAHSASRYWDNIVVAKCFGDGPTGLYNLAYNLADIPAVHIGEQLATVLLPSFARLDDDRRPAALERATALLSLIIFPMAVGLGLVARPLVRVALSDEWQGVAPLLTVLSVLSVFRPVTWVLSAYMESQAKTRRLMMLEVVKLFILLGAIAGLSPLGIEWSAGGVGLAFGMSAIIGVKLVAQDGPSPWRIFRGFAQPLAACALMGAAVIGVRHALAPFALKTWVELLVEIGVGGVAYVAAALVVCHAASRDLLRLVAGVLRGKRAPAGDEAPGSGDATA